MCGRYTQTRSLEDLRARFGAIVERLAAVLKPSFNIAPGQEAAVVTGGAEHRLEVKRWGLVPSWAREPSGGYKMINARSESVSEKPAFKRLLNAGRCLVPADGFFEWRKEPGQSGKIPMRFQLKSEELFGFAGLCDRWEGGEGEVLETFTILTTRANELVKPVHDRMPVILKREREALWLQEGPLEAGRLEEVVRPFPAPEMKVYRVSSKVNSPRNNSSECVQEVHDQPSLFDDL